MTTFAVVAGVTEETEKGVRKVVICEVALGKVWQKVDTAR